MSKVLTTKQLSGVIRGNIGYQLSVLGNFRQYRILQADISSGILKRFWDLIAAGDDAYVLEEYQMWQSWMDEYLGGRFGIASLRAKEDASWIRKWKLHLLPSDFLTNDPSPQVLIDQQILSGGIPTLPQEPQKRVRINCEGSHRTIRIHD